MDGDSLIERISKTTHIISHDSCADGTASALILRDALPNAKVSLVQYGTEAYRALVPQEGQQYLFCDMTPSPEAADAFRKAGAVVLDHHYSTRDLVRSFGQFGVYADEKEDPGISGAMLAYETVWRPMARASKSEDVQEFVRDFAELSGIYDTWQRQDERWKPAQELVRILHFQSPMSWVNMGLSRVAEEWRGKYAWMGPILNDKAEKSAARTFKGAERITTGSGMRIIVANIIGGGVNSIVELAGQGADLVVGFGYEMQSSKRSMVCSLRSHTGYDCSALARRYGGGGHKAASGFSVAAKGVDPYTRIRELVEQHEDRQQEKGA